MIISNLIQMIKGKMIEYSLFTGKYIRIHLQYGQNKLHKFHCQLRLPVHVFHLSKK